MGKNKKIVSFVVALTMIMTMLSSFVVVNAAAPEVYTEVTKGTAENEFLLKIGYKNFTEDFLSVGTMGVKVQIPDGFTATRNDVTFEGDFAKLQGLVNVTAANVITIERNDGGFNFDIAASDVIATVKLTADAEPTETQTFAVAEVNIDNGNGKVLKLDDGSVTATNGEYVVVKPITGPAVYVEDATVQADGKVVIKIGYKNFTEDFLSVGTMGVKVQIPDGFTATRNDVTFEGAFAGLQGLVNVTAANVVTIERNDGGFNFDIAAADVIATVTLTAPDDFDGTATVNVIEVNIDNGNGKVLKLDDESAAAIAGKITVAGNDDGGDDGDDGDKDTVALTLDKEAVSLEQGATATVNYTVTPAGTAVTATCVDTANISSVTAADGVITIVAQATATEGTYDVVVKAGDVTKTIKVTITKKVEVAFKGTLTKVADNDSFANRSYLKATFTAATEDIDAIVGTDTYVLVFDGKNGDFLAGSTLVKVSGETLKKIIAGTETIEVSIPGAVAADSSVSVLDSSYKTIAAK